MKHLLLGLLLLAAAATQVDATPVGPVRFQHLTIDDGLPEDSIRAILQDRRGFLWFGTHNGLARFDGTEMEVHLPDPDDSASIGIRTLLALAEDEEGGIWAGSYSAGVSRFDPVSRRFANFTADGDSLPGPGVPTIRAESDGVWFASSAGGLHRWRDGAFERVPVEPFAALAGQGLTGLDITPRELWVGSAESGLALLDRNTGIWRHFRHDPADPASLPSDFVTFVHRDSGGRVWVAGRAGLALNRGDGTFTVHKPRPDLGAVDLNYLVCITEDTHGIFWIGAAVGLYRFDPATGEFTLYAHDPERPHSPVRGPVLSVLSDASGIIWAGSWHAGLNKYDPGSRKFDVYLHDPRDPHSLDDDAIGSVFEDSRGVFWVGTGSRSSGGTFGGLNRRLPGERGFEQIPFPESPGARVRTVRAMAEDAAGVIWLGTNVGVWQVDPACDCIVRPPDLPSTPATVYNGSITDMLRDRSGRIWIAGYWSGLHRFDPAAGTWTSYRHDPDDPHSLPGDDLTTLGLDDVGRMWIGTDSGRLGLYDSDIDGFRRLTELDATLETVMRIVPADGGRMWIGSGSGILLCEPDRVVKTYSTLNGLPSNETNRIVVDASGILWASTGLGLTRIDPETDEITVFDERDGLPRNELHFAACSTADGRLHFGGHHGLVGFHPDSLSTRTFLPPVHVTEIRVRDERLRVGPDSPLPQDLGFVESIELDHDQNDISLAFAALDYAHPERNRYRFRLDPYDGEWREDAGRRFAQYTNLDPGDYVFRVMGSNGDGLWNVTTAELRLVISPPWWRTAWANAIWVATFLLVIIGAYRMLLNRERIRMDLEIERAEAGHLQDLDQLKSRFFANLSHEFRTPLTLLASPLPRLQEDPASGSAELFKTMARNARRLGRLIDQLLDLSRLEAERMPSRWRHGDWLKYVRALTSPFAPLADQRHVVLTTALPATTDDAWYDQDLLDKVLVNLLSNALKFTPGGGEITFTVTVDGETVDHPWPGQAAGDGESGQARKMTATVRNTGSYIPREEIAHVFDRFHQVVEDTDYGDLGSGIGLALVRELAEWCGGSVEVASDRQTGTAFTVVLPLYLEAPPDADVVAGEPRRTPDIGAGTEEAEETEDLDEAPDSDRPQIVFVEDNADLRAFVREELADEFHVLVAANGRQGLDLARSEIPDLVLSDIMMPEMDGLELCAALKSDDLTNHVPVILLTAKAETDSRREGLETGADDYVAKPFNVEELRIRMRNLIAQRRLLAERYAQLEVAQPGKTVNPVVSADDRFLVKIREIIAGNLENPDFRVEALCKEIGMSRTQLHRKLTAVAGRSAGEFLRIERLNRAAEMLSADEGNVTEVAYSVGYRSLSQFAKAFREQFGIAPSDFEA